MTPTMALKLIRRADAAEALLLRDLVERVYSVYVERIGRRPAPMDDNYDEKAQQGRVFVADGRHSGAHRPH